VVLNFLNKHSQKILKYLYMLSVRVVAVLVSEWHGVLKSVPSDWCQIFNENSFPILVLAPLQPNNGAQHILLVTAELSITTTTQNYNKISIEQNY
ncbi:hypothetical protein ACJX0J_021044, partial [Zea mays]